MRNPKEAHSRGGRPRVAVDVEHVRDLIAQGLSLRKIAQQLRLGYGTVHRAAHAPQDGRGLIQNSSTEPMPEASEYSHQETGA
jgi:DNA invertase Pin-like site-specific DNA recombinase